jgi:hypothetical protein
LKTNHLRSKNRHPNRSYATTSPNHKLATHNHANHDQGNQTLASRISASVSIAISLRANREARAAAVVGATAAGVRTTNAMAENQAGNAANNAAGEAAEEMRRPTRTSNPHRIGVVTHAIHVANCSSLAIQK